MRLLSLPTRAIGSYGSTGVAMDFLPRVTDEPTTSVHVARLEPGGTLGRHPATITQLFAVIEGDGEVAGADGVRVPIAAGQAALWEAGEEHQSWAITPMIVVLVESTGEFDLSRHLPDGS